MSTTEHNTYTGNCHCGAYKFTLACPPLTSAYKCNCSICSRNAYLSFEVPAGADLTIERGEDKLTRYTFGPGKWAHDFCPKCGINGIGKQVDPSSKQYYVNARVLQDLDLSQLEIKEVDGKGLVPGDWKAKEPVSPPIIEGEGLKTYNGQCHCGKVRYAFKSKPLEDIEANECDCSYCSRTGQLAAYIPHENINWEGLEHCTIYQGVGAGGGKHRFCSTCGVYAGMDTKNVVIPEEQLQYIPPDVVENLKKCPTNLRMIDAKVLNEKGLNIKQWRNKGGYSVE